MDRTTTAPRWQKGNMILDPFTNESRWEIYDIKMGGMGIVYVVYDHKFHEPFAAKTFRDEVVRDKPHIADLFLQEALAWVNLDFHQNVTQARFVKYLQGKPFVFLEYVSGGDLESWIYDKHLPDDIPQTLRFAIQFCDGMIHAISKAITAHRDVKPANCLITHDSTLKVTDFGMAKSIAADKRHGGRGGTDPYMSPEQWDDFMGVDVRADIYSFGVMLFEMVTGQWPFNGRTRQEFEHLHRTQNPPSLKSKIRDLTPEISRLESVIQTCLQKDPANRFSNFIELRKQLADVHYSLTGQTISPLGGIDLRAWELVSKSYSLASLVRLEEGVTYCDIALKMVPNYVPALSNKGYIQNLLGQHAKALECCTKAVEIDPKFIAAWNNMGHALAALGKHDRAIESFDKALALGPTHIDVRYNKANSLVALDRREEALVYYDQVLAANSKDADAWFNKGMTLASLGRHEEAIKCFDEVLKIDRNAIDAWTSKGASLVSLGRTEQARLCFEETLKLSPEDERAKRGLAF